MLQDFHNHLQYILKDAHHAHQLCVSTKGRKTADQTVEEITDTQNKQYNILDFQNR